MSEGFEALARVLHEQHLDFLRWDESIFESIFDPFPADQCGNCQRYAGFALAAGEAPGEAREALKAVLIENRRRDHPISAYLFDPDDMADAILAAGFVRLWSARTPPTAS